MDSHDTHHHILDGKTLTKTFVALLVLTVLTVITARFDFGDLNQMFHPLRVDLTPLNITLAMLIATLKMGLVAAFFMGLKWDPKFHTIVFLGTFAFLGVFVAYTLADTLYRGLLDKEQAETIDFESPVDKAKEAAKSGGSYEKEH